MNISIANEIKNMGCGGIIRDCHGNVILGFVGPLFNGNPLMALLTSILYGLRSCMFLDIANITIKIEPSYNIQCIFNEVDSDCDSKAFYIVRDIKHLMVFIYIYISHVLKEGNACAVWLA
ncbi:hypothetical protein KFK09_017522 [Dendrobium nobile]|uniref:RNase H type-1 domain-containing protein n=1 Tax=Dendrobium nobile TaxID=94219 RepID=A0A8T3B385_DENNO|nr:hypothetical protein KFK09_017522 [Dendrobium nobile]